MLQACKLAKNETLLHQRCKLVNRQKWTITAQNINIKVIGSSNNGTKWLNYRCVNCSNCRTNYWKVLIRNINHVSWQCIDWCRLLHLPANTSGIFLWVWAIHYHHFVFTLHTIRIDKIVRQYKWFVQSSCCLVSSYIEVTALRIHVIP